MAIDVVLFTLPSTVYGHWMLLAAIFYPTFEVAPIVCTIGIASRLSSLLHYTLTPINYPRRVTLSSAKKGS